MARVAVVTGGTRGIGRAIAIALKDVGYNVAANYGSDDAAAERFQNDTAIPVFKFNVADFQACLDGVAAVEAELGPIEVLVNNAGITRDTTMHRMSFEQWNAVIQTNLASCFNMSRAVIDGMRELFTSAASSMSAPINGQAGQYGQVNYAAAKSGIHWLHARRWPRKARHAGSPGQRRGAGLCRHRNGSRGAGRRPRKDHRPHSVSVAFGKAEDIARTVLFLVADDADFITGSTLSVNGGQHMY